MWWYIFHTSNTFQFFMSKNKIEVRGAKLTLPPYINYPENIVPVSFCKTTCSHIQPQF